MAKLDYPSVEAFFQKLLENIKPIFTTPKEWFVSIEFLSYFTRDIRIYIWSSGFFLCLVFLLYLFFLKKRQAKSLGNLEGNLSAKSKKTIPELVKTHGINENFTALITKIIAKDKDALLFFENANYFEKLVSEYTKKENFASTEENELSQIRHKLQFTTINPDISFVRTQQLHNGCVLKATIPDASYDISFETKVIENYESYFLVSYPQIEKEDYVLNSGQKILFEVTIAGTVYHFDSKVLPTNNNINNFTGLKLLHNSSITKTN